MARSTDPAEVPVAAEQPSIFFSQLPLELRFEIYTYVFTPSPCDKVSSQLAAPLLTCRQWYVEARSIAFATIDWRIDLGRACHDIYEEIYKESPFLEYGDQLFDSVQWREHTLGKDPFFPNRATLRTMFAEAKLTKQHITSLRRLTVVNCWWEHYTILVNCRPHQMIGPFFHDALAHCQLDCVTIELSAPPYFLPKLPFGFYQCTPDLTSIRDTKTTKSITLKGRIDARKIEVLGPE
jgi:hypothetical protein